MTSHPVRKITEFSFDALPQLSSTDLEFKRKLARAHAVLAGKQDLLETLIEPVTKLLKTRLKAHVEGIETVSLDDLVTGLPECCLIAQLRLDAGGGRGLLVFDNALAQLLVNMALGSGRTVPVETGIDMLRPLTPLSEGVFQYVVVSAIEKIAPLLAEQGLRLAFEDILREPARLRGVFANGDRFVLLNVSLRATRHDYMLRLILPLSVVEALSRLDPGVVDWDERRHGFEQFKADFHLEIGHVDLTDGDLAGLTAGDIVLLDECLVRVQGGRVIGGQATLKPCDGENVEGFVSDIKVSSDGIAAAIKSVAS